MLVAEHQNAVFVERLHQSFHGVVADRCREVDVGHGGADGRRAGSDAHSDKMRIPNSRVSKIEGSPKVHSSSIDSTKRE